MRCGLYGKLPAKRDFVAVAAPRAFLSLWEPWLEKGLATARARASGGDFADAFNAAPIWRFWLGPALCGEAIIGAFMPSIDALGRMFPLTLIGRASGAGELAPPDVDPREAWFGSVEDVLLDALDPQTSFESLLSRLEGLCAGEPDAGIAAPSAPDGAQTSTFWWTIGGPASPPRALKRLAMPGPADFADMLSRRGLALEPDDSSGKAPAQAGSDPRTGPRIAP